MSKKSAQSSEETEDVCENDDDDDNDGIGTVLQVCGLFTLLLPHCFLFSYSFQEVEKLKVLTG